MKIAFIGGGNMASAMLGGLLQQGYSPNEIGVVEIIADARQRLVDTFGIRVFAEATTELAQVEVIVFAVKPQQLADVAQGLAKSLNGQLVISIAAGIRASDLARWLNGYENIVRVMPNTPSLVRAGIAGLYAMPGVSSDDRARAEALMRSVGEVIWVANEADIDAVTAVSGSGPAYVFYFIEALEQAGLDMGLAPEAARALSLATFKGAAQLACTSEGSAATLRAKVTSKGGTTAAALAAMEQANLKQQFIASVKQAAVRSRELGDEFGKLR